MVSGIPEEILRDALACVLDYPMDADLYDVTFWEDKGARWKAQETLQVPDRRPPALALVCKSWQRICTPLLYRCVLLRSKAQVDALVTTITTLRPDNATHIRRLRLECNTCSRNARSVQGCHPSYSSPCHSKYSRPTTLRASPRVAAASCQPRISFSLHSGCENSNKRRQNLVNELAKVLPACVCSCHEWRMEERDIAHSFILGPLRGTAVRQKYRDARCVCPIMDTEAAGAA